MWPHNGQREPVPHPASTAAAAPATEQLASATTSPALPVTRQAGTDGAAANGGSIVGDADKAESGIGAAAALPKDSCRESISSFDQPYELKRAVFDNQCSWTSYDMKKASEVENEWCDVLLLASAEIVVGTAIQFWCSRRIVCKWPARSSTRLFVVKSKVCG